MEFEYSNEYARAFGDLAERLFRVRFFPKEAVEGWRWLVNEVKNGYDDVPPEYDNDLDTTRDPLDTFLVDDTLNNFPDHETFKQFIQQLDREFKELTQVHPKWEQDRRKWWNNRVPKYAGREYVEFFHSDELKKIGLSITLIDKQ
ncbi:MAG: hypothetical protein ABIQ74_00500 [Chitinophagales bacterium]